MRQGPVHLRSVGASSIFPLEVCPDSCQLLHHIQMRHLEQDNTATSKHRCKDRRPGSQHSLCKIVKMAVWIVNALSAPAVQDTLSICLAMALRLIEVLLRMHLGEKAMLNSQTDKSNGGQSKQDAGHPVAHFNALSAQTS